MAFDAAQRDVLTTLQRGVALVERPFRGMALPEEQVVRLLRQADQHGLLRRFGGIFDARRLGYSSVLCAVEAGPDRIRELAAVLSRHPGVTHCYERHPLTGPAVYPTLWFTLSLQQEHVAAGMHALREQLPGTDICSLPALRRFKVEVVFDLRQGPQEPSVAGTGCEPAMTPAVRPLPERDRRLVRVLGGSLPLSRRPFDVLAHAAGLSVSDLLAKLAAWQQEGMLRRIAPVLHHRRAGFTSNGMCAWRLDGDVAAAGRRLAARPEVTHCYQRPRLPTFPFDLFAMIHAQSRPELASLFARMSAACSLPSGTVLVSTVEYKKSSLQYFAETSD